MAQALAILFRASVGVVENVTFGLKSEQEAIPSSSQPQPAQPAKPEGEGVIGADFRPAKMTAFEWDVQMIRKVSEREALLILETRDKEWRTYIRSIADADSLVVREQSEIIDTLRSERDQLRQLVKDDCEKEEACRTLLKAYDTSDSHGVVPLPDLIEIALNAQEPKPTAQAGREKARNHGPLYIRFSNLPVASTQEIVDDAIMLDLDAHGWPVGMELLGGFSIEPASQTRPVFSDVQAPQPSPAVQEGKPCVTETPTGISVGQRPCTCNRNHAEDDEHAPWCGGPNPNQPSEPKGETKPQEKVRTFRRRMRVDMALVDHKTVPLARLHADGRTEFVRADGSIEPNVLYHDQSRVQGFIEEGIWIEVPDAPLAPKPEPKGERVCACGHPKRVHRGDVCDGTYGHVGPGSCPCICFQPRAPDKSEVIPKSERSEETCRCGHPKREHDGNGCRICDCGCTFPTVKFEKRMYNGPWFLAFSLPACAVGLGS
jgi:hypothetical protein